jgi:16S rRNA (guanine527-N7)-methyltransferase
MTEEQARDWIIARYGEGAMARLLRFVASVRAESERQNLIAASTLPHIWARHVVDSAQLVERAAHRAGPWLDIGTGAGFPGMVAALLGRDVTMVEPRRRRAEFLQSCLDDLGVGGSRVVPGKVESLAHHHPYAVISARAVAALPRLLGIAAGCADLDTLWLLPKGVRAQEEVAIARQTWHGTFHVEHSITDPSAMIVVATGVRRR